MSGPRCDARQHLQGAVFGIGLRERDPRGDLFVRIEAEIGAVLMPGDIGAILAAFGKDRSAEQHDVGTHEIFERVEDGRTAAELDQPRHCQMTFDLQAAIGAFAHLGLVGGDPRRTVGCPRGIHRAQRRQPALFAKMRHLRIG